MFSETQVSSHLLCILKSKEPTVEKVDFSGNLAAETSNAYSSQPSQQTAIFVTLASCAFITS